MDSSLNEEIVEGGIMLNHAMAGPFQSSGERSASYRVLIPMQFHLVLIGVEVVDGILGSIECFHLLHPEFGWKRVA